MSRRPHHYYLMQPWRNQKYTKKRKTCRKCSNEADAKSLIPESRQESSVLNQENSCYFQMTIDETEIMDNLRYDSVDQHKSIANSFDSYVGTGTERTTNISNASANQNKSTVNWNHADRAVGPEIIVDDDREEFIDEIVTGMHTEYEYIEFANNLCLSDVLFMTLNFYIKHKLSQSALEDLLNLLNTLTRKKPFPQTFATFAKQFPDRYGMERNYFCVNCQYGYNGKPQPDLRCPVENCGYIAKDFFITIPIEPQIRELYLKYSQEIAHYEEYIKNNNIADINRGKLANNIFKKENYKFITLSANEDGVAAYKCTNKKPPSYQQFTSKNKIQQK
ncbi:uncharacterized protein LOC129730808 [Wyeomyia smithii]|uniref:uncharacterized protein LOC129730808 n=1 Tax=Wyeomyia smithii TaxID=174621 RepID=UPI002467E671|nr:uncharacterized protein LOC129730808 [Wyeomyia smithii]